MDTHRERWLNVVKHDAVIKDHQTQDYQTSNIGDFMAQHSPNIFPNPPFIHTLLTWSGS